jgi:NAD(P)-dependent dehydrogenase (short-subunit alcohol dehydrogenase family)
LAFLISDQRCKASITPNVAETSAGGSPPSLFCGPGRTPGDIDILLSNAGISVFGPTAEVEMAAYDKTFVSNVRAPLFLVGALAAGLVARGRGGIISVSSMASGVGLAGGAAYGATKAVARGDDSRLAGRVQRQRRTRECGLPRGRSTRRRCVHHRAGGRRR